MKWFWLVIGMMIGASVTTIGMTVFMAWVFKDAE